jgi:hypothetical protein
MTDSQEQIDPRLFNVDENGEQVIPEAGFYHIDEYGTTHRINPSTISWQSAIDKIKWEDVSNLIENHGKRGAKQRLMNILGIYCLVAIIICVVSYLAFLGIIEGQALIAFLGTAIGYIISREDGK